MSNPLDEMSTAELGKLFPIQLVPHNTQWKAIFNAEKTKLENCLDAKDIISIKHIGSTSIPTIAAKPIIDILLEIQNSANLQNLRSKLEKLDYHFTHQPDSPPPHITFFKGYTPSGFKGQAYHLHLRYQGVWHEVIFRDYLLAHPEHAVEYENLKIKLAEKYRFDREAYTEAKTDFITRILEKANTEKKITR